MASKDWRSIARSFFQAPSVSNDQVLTEEERDAAFERWWNVGRHKGESPHPLFDTKFYRSQSGRQDLAPKDAFLHFIEYGGSSNHDPHPCFSMAWYRLRYVTSPDLHPWIDYIQRNGVEREPNWLFSSRYALGETRPRPGETPLAKVLASTTRADRSPHPLLDQTFVTKHNADIDPDNFYVSFWIRYRTREIRTHLLFDPKYYLGQVGRGIQINALADYILRGEAEDARPNRLFWPRFYAEQIGQPTPSACWLEHYLTAGERSGHHPCPGFDPSYYLLKHNDVARAGVSPLAHFIASGQKALRRPHRRFDIAWYASTLDEADRGRALEHFLTEGLQAATPPYPALHFTTLAPRGDALLRFLAPKPAVGDYIEGLENALLIQSAGAEAPFDAAVTPQPAGQACTIDRFERTLEGASQIDADLLKRNEPIARQLTRFDEIQSSALIERVISEFETARLALPLVSVIMPTRNRARVLKRAISSVLSQTYENLELIVVDDGSTDGTADLIRLHFHDTRIRYEPRPALGVSAARNAGLELARGHFVAYLDSDNYWEPLHLEITVKLLLLTGKQCAYDVLRAFNEKGDVKYRGDIYCRDALDRENYIDMNVFLHDLSFRDKHGIRFDEDLKRCVDWDFILRCAHLSDPLFVPIVGCNYVDESHELERITTSELSGDFYKVCLRNINLSSHLSGTILDGTPDFSMIWPIANSDWAHAKYEIWKVIDFVRKNPCELIIVNNALGAEATNYVNAIAKFTRNVRVINLWRPFIVFPAFNLGAQIARGRWLISWSSTVRFDGEAFGIYLDTHRNYDRELTFPIVKDANGCVTNEIATVELTSVVLHPALTGRTDLPSHGSVRGLVPVNSVFGVRRDVFDEAGGFSSKFANRYGLADFAIRHLWDDPKSTVLDFSTVFQSLKPAADTQHSEERKELELFQEAWLGRLHVEPILPAGFRLIRARFQKYVNIDWKLRVPPRDGMGVSPPAIKRTLTIAIRCPAPNDESKLSWGDYHFALCMKDALTRLGSVVRVELLDAWTSDRPAADIYIHIRGIVDVRPVPSALNVMWVISHPDKISAQEFLGMGQIFVAGPVLKQKLWTDLGVPSEVLLQATDGSRFNVEGRQTIEGLSGKALFVGNSRMQPRAIVSDAVQCGLPLQIYGRDWDAFITPSYVAGHYIPNEQLGDWYGSAGVVLNDHWTTMRKHGILSNRLFDAVACGSPVITDEVAGLAAIFGDAVRSYHSSDELSHHFHDLCGRRFVEEAKFIQANHTFDARMKELLRDLR